VDSEGLKPKFKKGDEVFFKKGSKKIKVKIYGVIQNYLGKHGIAYLGYDATDNNDWLIHETHIQSKVK
jgi:signal peptidase I